MSGGTSSLPGRRGLRRTGSSERIALSIFSCEREAHLTSKPRLCTALFVSWATDTTRRGLLAFYPVDYVASLPSCIAAPSIGTRKAYGLREAGEAAQSLCKVARTASQNRGDICSVQQTIWCELIRDLPRQGFEIYNHANYNLAVGAFWQLERQLVHVAISPTLQPVS